MKFPKHIQMQMKLPRYKNKRDLHRLIALIEGLRISLCRMAPSTFDDSRLLHNFSQHVLALANSHEQCFHLSPHLSTLQRQRAQNALDGLTGERVYQPHQRAESRVEAQPSFFIDSNDANVNTDPSVGIDDLDVDDADLTLALGSLDGDDEIIMVDLSVENNHIEQRILAEEISGFIDVEFQHPLYSSFQHIGMIQKGSGIYHEQPPELLYRAAQLILINILSKDEVCIQNLMLEATSFLNGAIELSPSNACPRGLWDWAKAQRRKGEKVRATVILMCSLLSEEKERPALSWLLDCRSAINCRHSAQWSR